METTNNKLVMCEVCTAERAKYTCPKCEVRTCGLSCMNIHKKELNCNGIRDKTKFIPLHAFTDLDLLSDYRLLEDIGRSVEQFQKNLCKRPDQLPVHLQRLKSAAYTRGISLEFLPRKFSRRQDNTTFLDWKTDEFSWRVEFIFPQAENTKWVIEKVPDTSRLSLVLEEIFYSDASSVLKNDESCNRLLILQNKLKYYRACGLTGVKALLKSEKVERSDSRFYELEFDQSLRENLKNKTVIEFPIIYVVLKDHSSLFEIIDSDEEIKEIPTRKWTNRKVNSDFKKRPMKSRETPKVKEVNSIVNYFFNTEISDSDEDAPEMNSQIKSRNKELAIPNYNDLVKM